MRRPRSCGRRWRGPSSTSPRNRACPTTRSSGRVDEVLLPIPEGERPVASEWPGRYIERASSDLALIERIYDRNTRSPALRAWLEAARSRGELGPGPLARLAHIRALAKALDARNPALLETVDLARVPPVDRGQVLARLLNRDAASSADSGPTLELCGAAWSEGLRPGAPELPAIAKALADSDLLTPDLDPESWFHRARLVSDRLDPPKADGTASRA